MQYTELPTRPPRARLRAFGTYLARLIDPDRPAICWTLAAALTLVIESLARHRVFGGLGFLFENPIGFAASVCIIALTLHPAMLCRKRIPVLALVSTVWFGLGVTEFILMFKRVTPLSAVDFAIARSVMTIMTVYLTVPVIVLILLLVAAALTGLVILFIKSKKRSVDWKKPAISLLICAACLFLSVLIGLSTGLLDDRFPNLGDAYDDYGFTYCFSMSIVDKGVDRPHGYDEDVITGILNELEEEEAPPAADVVFRPNVIFVQLESFFDVGRFEGVTYSVDPLPCWHALSAQYPAGPLTVPAIGAGTVNTEFEVLTGMCVNDFGAGEYPYRTVMLDTTCETAAYDLLESGWHTHAIHDHQGTFYDRHKVYTHMGFESFTPIECFPHPTYNENGWAEDAILTQEILDTLASTEGPDFVFTVSVQGHGAYPTDYTPAPGAVTVTGGVDDPGTASKLNYYVTQLHDMDAFVGALTEAVMALPEDTVVFFYGDHLPSLSQDDGYTLTGSDFETCWLFVSNCDADTSVLTAGADDAHTGCPLYSFEVFPRVFESIGVTEGVINRLYQCAREDKDFPETRAALEYDVLYGEAYAYDGILYPVTDMTIGIRSVRITGTMSDGGTLTVIGEHFTPYSVVLVNGHEHDTTYIDEHTLTIRQTAFIDENDVLSVRQATTLGEALSESAPYCPAERGEAFDHIRIHPGRICRFEQKETTP